MARASIALAVLILAAALGSASPDEAEFLIGSGIYDITGPAADLAMMGYGRFSQTTAGISSRLYARAFVVAREDQRVAFVLADLCFITQAVKQAAIEALRSTYAREEYTEDNVMVAATHTHAGPGGYSYHFLYQVTTLGFCRQNFDVIVDGVARAVCRAHDNAAPGTIRVHVGEIAGANINRSPSAYMANPAAERARYSDDVDKEMTFLRLTQLEGDREIGVISWFPVHGTNLDNTNTLISGDNKGYAAYLHERDLNGGAMPGRGPFVAAYAQSAGGDSTPNVRGAVCAGSTRRCRGRGPGDTPLESCQIIGRKQYLHVKQHYEQASERLAGPLRYLHLWVDMENLSVPAEFSDTASPMRTCRAALGDSFGAGTTDGPGSFNFVQGTNDTRTNAYWNWFFSKLLHVPSDDDIRCHHPKPILFFTSPLNRPAKYTQSILPIQLFNLGQLWIAGVPAELTTMAGRRLRLSILRALDLAGASSPNTIVLLTCLANSYSHYVTTREEYAIQRYEGSSVLFGPSTLNAYQMLFHRLARQLAANHDPTTTPAASPERFAPPPFVTLPLRLSDAVPCGFHFGSLHLDALPAYRRNQIASATFWSAHPANSLRTNDTYLTVERADHSSWTVVANDATWDTKYVWERVGFHYSLVTVEWLIPPDARAGRHRIRHFGDTLLGANLVPFEGISRTFEVS